MSDLLKFPCEFTIKIVGAEQANVEEIAVPILQKNDVDIETIKITTKQSSTGKYTSLTVIMNVDSKEQLDNIYRELSSHSQISMVL